MKIISKEKDFYDYVVPFDKDDDLVFVRTPHFETLSNNKELNAVHKKGFKHPGSITMGYLSSSNYTYQLALEDVCFGVYPNIYSQSFITIYRKLQGFKFAKWELHKNIFIPVSRKYLKAHSNDEIISYFLNYSKLNISKKDISCNLALPEKDTYYTRMYNITYEPLECPEIFTALKSPVFIQIPIGDINSNYTRSVGVHKYLLSIYDFYFNDVKDSIAYITNVSFNMCANKGVNLLKYYMDDMFTERNIYTDIENFLWSIKQEPISEPSNNTKIVNAGFDLKTSFRNM